MSIQTQIARLQTVKSNIAAAIGAKGVTVSEGAALSDMPELIGQISQGGDNSLLMSIISRTATSIVLPEGLSKVGHEMFYRCVELTSVTFPESITTIDGSAFAHCTGLTSITIPANVKRVLSLAFYNCTGLTSVTFKGIPMLLVNGAFGGCTNLTDIYVPWSEYNVPNAPWGAANATIHYDSV